MKGFTALFFTAFAIYMIWQFSRVSIKSAIAMAIVALVVLIWIFATKERKRPSSSFKDAREQQDLINKK